MQEGGSPVQEALAGFGGEAPEKKIDLRGSFWDVHYSESESKKCFSCGEMSDLQAEIACSMEMRSVPQKMKNDTRIALITDHFCSKMDL